MPRTWAKLRIRPSEEEEDEEADEEEVVDGEDVKADGRGKRGLEEEEKAGEESAVDEREDE